MPLPVILDTDIGTDIDDAYALVLAAASPELDLLAVTTVNNDTCLRARIATALLRRMGRTDVPVYRGERAPLTPGETRGWAGHEGRGIDLSGIRDGTIPADAPAAIGRLARQAHNAGRSVTILTVGAMTNLAVAVDRYPEDARLISRVVAMASDFRGFGVDNGRTEHNVACDPVAVQKVLSSGLSIALCGLNVTQQTAMTINEVSALESVGGPLAHALGGMHRVWFDVIGKECSPMHDPLAVASVIRPELLQLQKVAARVSLDTSPSGSIVYSRLVASERTNCRVAVGVDTGGFHRLLQERIRGAAVRSRDAVRV